MPRPKALNSIEVLGFIIQYIEQNGFAPSRAEIGKHFGRHESIATRAVNELNAHSPQYIKKEHNVARSLVVTQDGQNAWAAHMKEQEEQSSAPDAEQA